MLTRLASQVGVPPQELKNVLLLTGVAVVSGIGVYVVRGTIPYITFETGFRGFQFSLAYVLLGLLPVLFSRSIGTEGKAISIFLLISIVIGMSIRPHIDLINVVIVLLVMLGGFTYYGVYSQASNRELLLLIGAIIVEGYLFSVFYMWRTFELTSDLRVTVLTVLYLTGVLIVLGKLLLVEYRKATAGAGWQP
jgi:hypothetical protein